MSQYRKIIALGRSTFCLTLPKEWVVKNAIEKGGTVFVKETPSGGLSVTAKEGAEEHEEVREIIIHINGKEDENVHREIIAAYVQDYTDIVLMGDLGDRLEKIKEILKDLLALEIMSVTPTRAVAKVFLDTTHTSLHNVLRRLDMINRTMFEQTKLTLERKEHDTQFDSLIEVERLSYVALRCITRGLTKPHFAKQLNVSVLELLFLWQVVDRLRKVAERVHAISDTVAGSDGFKDIAAAQRTEMLAHFSTLEQLYRDTLHTYYKKDRTHANDLIKQHVEFRMDVGQLFSKKSKEASQFAELVRRASSVLEDVALISMEQL